MDDQPKQIGAYRVDGELGRGGMGVVFLGHDTRLERPVAIKALPQEFAADPERLARFEREARILASLSHPNVAGIYGLEESDGAKYLILEYVEGENLADRLALGPIPMEDALDIFRQIAMGVEAAHEAGVIHRDLKPGNVKITSEGHVKVLDFGLAKPVGSDPPSGPDLTQSPTLTYGAEKDGVVLGTAGYMSPEQARGRRVDRRTDIWAMGCILYEMLSDKQAFQGETISDTLAAVLRGEPDWDALPPHTPEAVWRLLRRCLEKDPKRRMRDAADVMIELNEAVQERPSEGTRDSAILKSWTYRGVFWAVALLAVLCLSAGWGLAILVGRNSGPRKDDTPPTMVSIEIPKELQFQNAALAPDGHVLAVLAFEKVPGDSTSSAQTRQVSRIYTRRMDSFDLQPIRGTEGARGLAFSPDSKWLAFIAPVAPDSSKYGLMKVPVDGGTPPVAVAPWKDVWNDFTWLPDGDFLVCQPPGTSFLRVSSAGRSPPKEFEVADGIAGTVNFQSPRSLPIPGYVLLGRVSYGPRGFQMDTVIMDLKTGSIRTILEDAGFATYSAAGYLLFSRGDTLLAAPFNLAKLQVTGGPVAILGGLKTKDTWAPAPFGLSAEGTIVYVPGGRAGGQRLIVTLAKGGTVAPWSSDQRAFNGQLAATHDGRRIAVGITRPEGLDEIWISDSGSTSLRRFASMPDADLDYPVWSSDGRRLAFFRSSRSDKDGLYWQKTDGPDQPHPLVTANTSKVLNAPCAWTPDGKAIIFVQTSIGEGKAALMRVEVPENGGPPPEPKVFLESGKYSQLASFSRDGKLFSFTSNVSGQSQVYVCTYSAEGRLGTPVAVSEGIGYNGLWASDGKSLAYLGEGGRLHSVDINTKDGLAPSKAVLIADAMAAGLISGTEGIDRLPDGRFIMVKRGEGETEVNGLHLVLNSAKVIQAKVPGGKR